MKLKSRLLMLLTLISVAAGAQDKIYKTDGKVIDVKVNTVGNNTITYHRFDNQDGPEYTILKKEVNKIVYQNGTTDNFDGRQKHAGKSISEPDNGKVLSKYGNNIFTITPGAYTKALDETINDAGIGITYERLLDDNAHIGFVVPITMNFASKRDFNGGTFFYGSKAYTGDADYHSFCFAPGVKFYPGRKKDAVRYAIGGSFFALFGKEPYQVYDNSITRGDWNYHMYGLMISNSINASVTKHFYIELDLNAGIPFSDNRRMNHEDIDYIIGPFMQMCLKVGGRF